MITFRDKTVKDIVFRRQLRIRHTQGVDDSYVSRIVNLTTLAPDIVAAILDETLSPEVTLFELAAGTPLLWDEQRGKLEGNKDQP